VDEPRDEVSNDLVTLGLELRVQVVLSAVVHLYLSVQRGDVRLVAQLPALKLGYVLRVHITARLEVSGFPVGECLIRYQPIHTFDRSEQEGARAFEPSDVVGPRVNHLVGGLLVSDCIEPLDLLVDVVLALDPFELQLVGLERVLESVSVDCLG